MKRMHASWPHHLSMDSSMHPGDNGTYANQSDPFRPIFKATETHRRADVGFPERTEARRVIAWEDEQDELPWQN